MAEHEYDYSNLQPHAYADIFPLIEGEEFERLCASVREDGLLQPVTLFEGRILDGRNRYRALQSLGLPLDAEYFKTFCGDSDEALRYAAAANLDRRHLTPSQRAMAASKIATLQNGQRSGGNVVSMDAAARQMQVSKRMIVEARRARRELPQHIVAMVESGSVKLSAASKLAELDDAVLAGLRTPQEVKTAARQLRTIKPLHDAIDVLGVVELALQRDSVERTAATIPNRVKAIGRLNVLINRLCDLRSCLERLEAEENVA